MNNEDWAKRWIDGKTAWHKNTPNERLLKYFPKETKRVFVPLCGKTVDLIWLSDQNVEVLGAEFSSLAIEAFMKDHNLEFSIEKINDESSIYTCAGKKIQFYQGDFFNMPEDGKFRDFDLIWDRASMVAINPPDREKYANKINSLLTRNGEILLEALEREKGRVGPPHTLTQSDVRKSYELLNFKLLELESHVDLERIERMGRIEVHNYRLTRN